MIIDKDVIKQFICTDNKLQIVTDTIILKLMLNVSNVSLLLLYVVMILQHRQPCFL